MKVEIVYVKDNRCITTFFLLELFVVCFLKSRKNLKTLKITKFRRINLPSSSGKKKKSTREKVVIQDIQGRTISDVAYLSYMEIS
jgi:hypothetical protein